MIDLLKRVYRLPGGRYLVARAIGWTAPYSGSIKPEVLELGAGRARLRIQDRKRVRNHLNSIHACALATLTETTVGLSVLYSLPAGMRGIATRLAVDYHAKARGPITSRCEWSVPSAGESVERDIEVRMTDEHGTLVATGVVGFRVGPARRG